MARPVRTRRKNMFNLHREAEKMSSFDEFPMLRPEVDPQLHLSRNEVDQPFHLICEKDTVLAQMSGRARVEFIDGPVRYFDMVPGDFVYVPGGSLHRVKTVDAGTQMRYKANDPGAETVLWMCSDCGAELHRLEWDASASPAQAGYQSACEQFNADATLRQCKACGHEHPAVDLSPFRWAAIAEKLSEPEEAE